MNRFQAQNKRERIFSPRKNYRRGKKFRWWKKLLKYLSLTLHNKQQQRGSREKNNTLHRTVDKQITIFVFFLIIRYFHDFFFLSFDRLLCFWVSARFCKQTEKNMKLWESKRTGIWKMFANTHKPFSFSDPRRKIYGKIHEMHRENKYRGKNLSRHDTRVYVSMSLSLSKFIILFSWVVLSRNSCG